MSNSIIVCECKKTGSYAVYLGNRNVDSDYDYYLAFVDSKEITSKVISAMMHEDVFPTLVLRHVFFDEVSRDEYGEWPRYFKDAVEKKTVMDRYMKWSYPDECDLEDGEMVIVCDASGMVVPAIVDCYEFREINGEKILEVEYWAKIPGPIKRMY